jgi:hypothetical protein
LRSLVFDLLLFTVVARAALPPAPPLRSLVLDLLLLTVVVRSVLPPPDCAIAFIVAKAIPARVATVTNTACFIAASFNQINQCLKWRVPVNTMATP